MCRDGVQWFLSQGQEVCYFDGAVPRLCRCPMTTCAPDNAGMYTCQITIPFLALICLLLLVLSLLFLAKIRMGMTAWNLRLERTVNRHRDGPMPSKILFDEEMVMTPTSPRGHLVSFPTTPLPPSPQKNTRSSSGYGTMDRHLPQQVATKLTYNGAEEETSRRTWQPSSGPHNPGPTSDSQQPTLRHRVTAFYQHYAPHKVESVDKVLGMYEGEGENLMKALVSKYGPEPQVVPPASTSGVSATEEPAAAAPPPPRNDSFAEKRRRLTTFVKEIGKAKQRPTSLSDVVSPPAAAQSAGSPSPVVPRPRASTTTSLPTSQRGSVEQLTPDDTRSECSSVTSASSPSVRNDSFARLNSFFRDIGRAKKSVSPTPAGSEAGSPKSMVEVEMTEKKLPTPPLASTPSGEEDNNGTLPPLNPNFSSDDQRMQKQNSSKVDEL